MVVAYLMLIVFFLVMLNLAVDILYSVLDPRVRLEGGATMTDAVLEPCRIVAAKPQTPFAALRREFLPTSSRSSAWSC